jgi:hypothetical protein
MLAPLALASVFDVAGGSSARVHALRVVGAVQPLANNGWATIRRDDGVGGAEGITSFECGPRRMLSAAIGAASTSSLPLSTAVCA